MDSTIKQNVEDTIKPETINSILANTMTDSPYPFTSFHRLGQLRLTGPSAHLTLIITAGNLHCQEAKGSPGKMPRLESK
jgi:hypothetical protein